MIQIPLEDGRHWRAATPAVYRYLPAQFVDAFFSGGALRLSCFAQFRQHTDEQRLDGQEGEVLWLHRSQELGGQTITARMFHGLNAYVLSTSVRLEKKLMNRFKCDACIQIRDTTSFGIAVARRIEGFQTGVEGLCFYQENRIIEGHLPYQEMDQFIGPGVTQEEGRRRIEQLANEQTRHHPFFLKHLGYVQQAEYRFVWITTARVQDFLELKAPELQEYCARPGTFDW